MDEVVVPLFLLYLFGDGAFNLLGYHTLFLQPWQLHVASKNLPVSFRFVPALNVSHSITPVLSFYFPSFQKYFISVPVVPLLGNSGDQLICRP